ncbi:MAG: ABC transporter permease, partial [Roseiflexus sp.]|nr:ABC transporter permease [Roseiflexus sp.]
MATWRQRIRPEQIRELSLVVLIVAALLIFAWQIENFLSARTFNRIAGSVAIIGMVAIGQTLVVLTRNIDLSVGSIVGFTAYFVGAQLAANNDMWPLAAVALAAAVGGAMGLVNGLIVAYGRAPAIITTLGTLAIYRMLLINYSNARTVTVDSLPPWVVELSRQNLFMIGDFAVRPLIVATLVTVVVFQLVLGYTVFGRRLYAIGSNPEAARFAGLPAQRIVLTAFTLCGMLAGLAGFLF